MLNQLDEATIRNLGNNSLNISSIFETLEDLRKTTPAMAIAIPTRNFSFTQASTIGERPYIQSCIKDKPMVMSIFHYQSLEKDRTGMVCLTPSQETFIHVYRPYNGQSLDNKTLVVWRSGGIGDLLFIQPGLRHLKNKYPTCKIVFATSIMYMDMVKKWGFIDKVETFPMDLDIFKNTDYHLTFEGVIERCNEAKKLNAYKLFSKWMGITDITDDELIPVLDVQDKDIAKTVSEFLERRNINKKEYIVIQLRASSPIRTPSSRVWKEILGRLVFDNYKLVFTDIPDRQLEVSKVIDFIFTSNQKKRIYNFAPVSKNINYSILLAKYAKLVIAPDSSMIHIAAGVGTPVFGIYGPFAAELRMETYKNTDWIQPERSIICPYGGSQCFLHGHRPCPVAKSLGTNLYTDFGPSPCFELLDFNLAFKKIRELLKIKKGNR